MDALFIVHPDTSMPEALQQIRVLSEHAYKANIKKIVLLSGRGQDSVIACENVIQHSGLRWTIVRSAWFNQNFTEGHFAHGIKTGEVVFMAGQAGEPFVDLDDLADVVVASLLEPIHDNQVYEVTGDILYTFRDAVAIISKKSAALLPTVNWINKVIWNCYCNMVYPGCCSASCICIFGDSRWKKSILRRWH
ncbi:hypothetical protein KUH03_35170 [Sphingobacterium sp. E70]|uniref:SDR family oxidoreductase n=1 Tax=Sphingobacterium sp. E70 TaxID=2853439 RepID=UPI00211C0D5E|nr:hypothetical protein [Sphingobacterium sp. E70]ULT24218.1 hypothetical protein KUH03_35170 [Sphingobacterium sp. E70]